MIWVCLTSKGVGKPVFLDKTLTKEACLKVSEEHLKENARINNLGAFIFQHDGAQVHTAKIIKEYLKKTLM